MRTSRKVSSLLVGLSLIFGGCTAPVLDEDTYIARVRAFSMGGRLEPVQHSGIQGDIGDQVFSGQISVLGLVSTRKINKPPIIMLPGFGLSAAIYLETPDGRMGWAKDAIARGHDTYLVEPAHSIRAGINPDPYTRAQLGEPSETPALFTWGQQHVWRRWGLGPKYPVLFEDSRFPDQAFDNIVRFYSAVDVGRIEGSAMIQYQLQDNVAALAELLDQTGPAILLVHSAAGVTGFEVARQRPSQVLAVVNVEPVGCPTEDIQRWRQTSVLSVFGDHMEVRAQMPIRQKECQQTIDLLSELGTSAKMFALPEMGIRGNSHLLMAEDNSSELMNLILDWLDAEL